jgi:hypothetical protein
MESTILGLTPTTLFWTAFFVIGTFGLYIGIAVWARAGSQTIFMWPATTCTRFSTAWPPPQTG